MRPASAKAKGRRLQQEVAELLRRAFDLPEEDVKPAIMGERGRDIHLSERAARAFPFAIECKNVESLNIWKALDQAAANAGGLDPLLVFRRNRSETFCALRLQDLVELVQAAR